MNLRTKVMCLFSAAVLSAFSLLLGGVGFAAPPDKSKGKTEKPAAKVAPTTGTQMDHAALARAIDKAIDERLKADSITPSPLSTDAEFVRRLYLDVTGHIPSAEQAAAFLDDKEPNKRAKLIDELLASPDYGKHLADIWRTLLLPKNSENRRLDTDPMAQWLADNFNKNTPWSKMVHDLLTASGTQEDSGAVTFYFANGTVDKMTDQTCKLFLGVQLQCAQCHNHPFTDWKQTEYWEMAAFFMKVQVPNGKQAGNKGATVNEVDNPRRGKNALPESAKILSPKFLGGERLKKDSGPVRPLLADWLTRAQNPYFSRAMVNRVWSQYFGLGIVNPVDDMHESNPASHPELLQELSKQFAKSDFDLKYLVRSICNSQAYQRTSKPLDTNADAPRNLQAHMTVKVLSPEQLFDSLAAVLGKPDAREEGRKGGNKAKNQPGDPRSAFLNFFGVDDGAAATDYQTGIPQVLNLMNSPRVNTAIQKSHLVQSDRPAAEVIEKLYLSTVSRRPTAQEMERVTAHLKKVDAGKGYGDILWALLNSSEFTLNH